MSNTESSDGKFGRLAIAGGVIGGVLGAHGATPTQAFVAFTIGFGVFKALQYAIKAEREDPPGSWKKKK